MPTHTMTIMRKVLPNYGVATDPAHLLTEDTAEAYNLFRMLLNYAEELRDIERFKEQLEQQRPVEPSDFDRRRATKRALTAAHERLGAAHDLTAATAEAYNNATATPAEA